jgi:hypothetical protein
MLCGKILHVQKRPFPSNVSQAKAKPGWRPWLNSLQIGNPAALNLVIGVNIWLVVCLAFEPRLAPLQAENLLPFVRMKDTAVVTLEGGLVRVVLRHCIIYSDICLTTEKKPWKNLCQEIRKVLGSSALSIIRLVKYSANSPDLPTAAAPSAFSSGDGCLPWVSVGLC